MASGRAVASVAIAFCCTRRRKFAGENPLVRAPVFRGKYFSRVSIHFIFAHAEYGVISYVQVHYVCTCVRMYFAA